MQMSPANLPLRVIFGNAPRKKADLETSCENKEVAITRIYQVQQNDR